MMLQPDCQWMKMALNTFSFTNIAYNKLFITTRILIFC